MKTAITWFEIPVTDMPRATTFYGAVLKVTFTDEQNGGMEMAVFPYTPGEGVGGALARHPSKRPANTGVVVYLDAGGDLHGAVDRVAGAGGRVVMPVTAIGDPGFIALIEDTEGNVVGLHQARAAD